MGLKRAKQIKDSANNLVKLQEISGSIATRDSDGLLLPETIDLAALEVLSDSDLLGIVDASISSLQELENQIFRHAVRMATALEILERRAREQQGENFRKKQWLKEFLGQRFRGRLAPSTAMMYQQIARPENQEKAQEFAEKIERLQALKERALPDSELRVEATRQGIAEWEVEVLPDRFTVAGFRNYLAKTNKSERPERTRTRAIQPAQQKTITISIDGPPEELDRLEAAAREWAASYLEIPEGEIALHTEDKKSHRSGLARRSFTYPLLPPQ